MNIVLILFFLPLTTQNPFQKYTIPALFLISAWISSAYIFKRYKETALKYFFKTTLQLAYISLTVFIILGGFILIQPRSPYSQYILVTTLLGVFVIQYLLYFIYTSYKYAISYDTQEIEIEEREPAKALPSEPLQQQAISERASRIEQLTSIKPLRYLEKKTNLYNTGTKLIVNADNIELEHIDVYKYTTIIQLKKLNNLRGINNMFTVINKKLPDNGRFICYYRTLSSRRRDIYKRYKGNKGKIIYFFHFIFHQVMPKIALTRRFYYDFTDGKRRTLSKTEVLGRLRYCGFKIVDQAKVNDLNFIIAEREKSPNGELKKHYGALIKLKRVGKNGKLFNVYKFRTMHPYAEFIQDYIYEQNDLSSGGKFKRDIRVTKWGHFLRRYWLDELPMFINLIKRDMKLVGIRPISRHYFSLYSDELQTERVKHKPGLLPPFYADLPKTLEEIEQSELKYLYECNKKGTFPTDVKYFFLILRNILFNKARSA